MKIGGAVSDFEIIYIYKNCMLKGIDVLLANYGHGGQSQRRPNYARHILCTSVCANTDALSVSLFPLSQNPMRRLSDNLGEIRCRIDSFKCSSRYGGSDNNLIITQ